MYFDPRDKEYPLKNDPLTTLVVPRPIGWISTINRRGLVNLAPYSFFNAVASRPMVRPSRPSAEAMSAATLRISARVLVAFAR